MAGHKKPPAALTVAPTLLVALLQPTVGCSHGAGKHPSTAASPTSFVNASLRLLRPPACPSILPPSLLCVKFLKRHLTLQFFRCYFDENCTLIYLVALSHVYQPYTPSHWGRNLLPHAHHLDFCNNVSSIDLCPRLYNQPCNQTGHRRNYRPNAKAFCWSPTHCATSATGAAHTRS